MSATPALHIDKLRSRFVSAQALDQNQVRQWHEAMAEMDADELVGRLVRNDEWLLIRRLPLRTTWGTHSAAMEVSHVWWQALQSAVSDAAAHADPRNVLRYRTHREGLADMLYRSALGEVERQWAWQRMGLLAHEGVSASEALEQGLMALLDQPDAIWPVLHQLLQAERETGAFTALVRRWPHAAWLQCLRVAPQSREWMAQDVVMSSHEVAASNARASSADVSGPLAQSGEADGIDAYALPFDAQTPASPLWTWLQRHAPLARPLAQVWRVWLASLTWPDTASTAQASSKLAATQRALQSLLTTAVSQPSATSRRPDLSPGAHAASQTDVKAQKADISTLEAIDHRPEAHATEEDLPCAPALPDALVGLHTEWAGVLFLLRWMQDAQGQLAHAATSGASMQALLQAIGVPLQDPSAALLMQDLPVQDIPRALQAQADQLVGQWTPWLDEHLPDAPEPRLLWVCQRPGRIEREPGWIELHLDMDLIDMRLRRVGLDLDPGWVPMLNAVVRICYD